MSFKCLFQPKPFHEGSESVCVKKKQLCKRTRELDVPSRTEEKRDILVLQLLLTFNCLLSFYYQYYSSIYSQTAQSLHKPLSAVRRLKKVHFVSASKQSSFDHLNIPQQKRNSQHWLLPRVLYEQVPQSHKNTTLWSETEQVLQINTAQIRCEEESPFPTTLSGS